MATANAFNAQAAQIELLKNRLTTLESKSSEVEMEGKIAKLNTKVYKIKETTADHFNDTDEIIAALIGAAQALITGSLAPPNQAPRHQ